MRLAFVPKTTEFYDLFTRAGENLLATARLAEQRFREFPQTSVEHERVKELENQGDDLTKEIIDLLNTQYITPFDREDIYELAKEIDDVVDYIEHASDLLGLYKVDSLMEQAVDQCRVLVEAAEHLSKALAELRQPRRVEPHIVQVKQLEDEGDRIERTAIAGLFRDEVDPLTVIRWKDIFESLEASVDACEHVAHVLEGITINRGR
jgi:predicted phosphate transport protein (TIGR00153 family)